MMMPPTSLATSEAPVCAVGSLDIHPTRSQTGRHTAPLVGALAVPAVHRAERNAQLDQTGPHHSTVLHDTSVAMDASRRVVPDPPLPASPLLPEGQIRRRKVAPTREIAGEHRPPWW